MEASTEILLISLYPGDIFVDGADFMRDYHRYVTNFDLALSTLTVALQNPQFKKFLRVRRTFFHSQISFLISLSLSLSRPLLELFTSGTTAGEGVCKS